jgi:hypothetical protein
MKRSDFIMRSIGLLLAWAGISRAQPALNGNHCWAQDASGKLIPSNCGEKARWLATGKVLNNQCPVCGTMAEPFETKRIIWSYIVKPCVPPEKDSHIACTEANYGPDPGANLIRCKRCNAAFWQDWQELK